MWASAYRKAEEEEGRPDMWGLRVKGIVVHSLALEIKMKKKRIKVAKSPE